MTGQSDSRKTALKLAFAPDDYLVTWRIPSTHGETFSAHGALTVEADKAPRGMAHGDFLHALTQMKGGGFGFPQYVDAPVLTGRLANGANVVLINARVGYWFHSQVTIDAAAAVITLADVTDIKEPVFKSFDIQIGGLDAIAGVPPIKSTKIPANGMSGTWAAELNADFAQVWSDSGATLKLTYYGTFRSFDPYAFRMGFSPVLHIELDIAVPLDQLLDDWINPLLRVISIATGRAEEITYLAVYPITEDGEGRKSQLFGTGITQNPYEASQEQVQKVNAPLRLKSDEVSLLALVRTWQQLTVLHHPLVETYGAMLHARDQHPRSRFLLLLQAIEGAYGYETKASFAERLKEHQTSRDALIDLVRESLDERQLKFLKKNLGKRPPASLESAISWLAKQLPWDLKEQLDATLLVATSKLPPAEAKNAPDALRIIRNDLAHGNRGYEVRQLQEVVKILELATRAHALELLGCPNAVVERVAAA